MGTLDLGDPLSGLFDAADGFSDWVSEMTGGGGSGEGEGTEDQASDQTSDQTQEDQTQTEEEEPDEAAPPSIDLWMSKSGLTMIAADADETFTVNCDTNRPGGLVVVEQKRWGGSWSEIKRGNTDAMGEFYFSHVVNVPGQYDFRATLYVEPEASDSITDFLIYGLHLVIETPNRIYPYECRVDEWFNIVVYSIFSNAEVTISMWKDGVKLDAHLYLTTNDYGYAILNTYIAQAGVWQFQAECLTDESIKVTLTVNP